MAKRLTREESRARTREKLLDSASALFAERGVNGASVEQIAEHAGFSRGAFYGNFADKPELVAALLERRRHQDVREVSALAAGASDAAEVLNRLRAWHADRAENLAEWFTLRTELNLYALRNPSARPMVAEGERVARTAIKTGIEHRFRETLPPADPAFLALIVHALEDGLLLQRFICPEGTSDDVVVDAAELLLRGWEALARE
ncbi:TetR/AcrR family transcriptional regulator [Amycolatopsis minnesotensis]|uniref:TetR/AcrR family transcriptional regulator n=1 Tax=Amycolatopsis minnesotensis TaxID=337894 RepID=A0ABN2S6M7_9PSEU